jgi:glucokinase
VVAVDIGGTTAKGALALAGAGGASEGGSVEATVAGRDAPPLLTTRVAATEGGGPRALDAVVALIGDLIADAGGPGAVRAIGVAAPGTVDESAGVVVNAENLRWRALPLVERLSGAFGLPVAFGHDVRAGALAEWRWGAGRGVGDLVFVAVGTGVAAAVIVGGALVRGDGYAGEIGHGGATAGEPCVCGGLGCLEVYASGPAIARRYARLAGAPGGGAREVLALADAGDPIARAVWDRAVEALADAISGVVRLLGTPRVVVGGGLAEAGDALLAPLDAGVRARLTVHRPPVLLPAALGSRAGLYGAALQALTHPAG